MIKSALTIARASYVPKRPSVLEKNVKIEEGAPTTAVADEEELEKLFPKTFGRPVIKFVASDKSETP